MLRHHLPLPPAELIGYHLGLIVPSDALNFFYHARTGPRPPAGYGTQIRKPQYHPKRAFKKLGIPFQISQSLIDQFPTLDQFRAHLTTISQTDTDILICYDWPTLFDPDQTDHWGHVCVLDRVYSDQDQVRFIDPASNGPKWVTVATPDLYQAMLVHGSNKSAGFWHLTLTK